ncbi:LysE family translocator [Pelagibaculum spongiae]|uniref:Lysine transporter LysE n=1 Tax=Pelagibaculum spongiae TaxID=2080658 RepID=A0A2V1H118_9GAMM|nr:LysE family transporter [Pelagibaculum spongiae]PVZ72369.1 hypothetical protein DC094_05015 [Pelagibaculum spongiae]
MSAWLVVLSVSLVAAAVPGASLALVMRHTLGGGRKAGLLTMCGQSVSVAFYVALTLLGLGVVITKTPWLFNLIKWGGAACLFWMGVSAIRDSLRKKNLEQSEEDYRYTPFRDGLLVTILNPQVAVFFLAMFSQVVTPDITAGVKLLYGATAVGVGMVWFSCIVFLVSNQRVRKQLKAFEHIIERVMGGALLLLGIRVAVG